MGDILLRPVEGHKKNKKAGSECDLNSRIYCGASEKGGGRDVESEEQEGWLLHCNVVTTTARSDGCT